MRRDAASGSAAKRCWTSGRPRKSGSTPNARTARRRSDSDRSQTSSGAPSGRGKNERWPASARRPEPTREQPLRSSLNHGVVGSILPRIPSRRTVRFQRMASGKAGRYHEPPMRRLARGCVSLGFAALSFTFLVGYARCTAWSCTPASRFDAVVLWALGLAAAAGAAAVLVPRRLSTTFSISLASCFVGLYLFEATMRNAQTEQQDRLVDDVRKYRDRGEPVALPIRPIVTLRDGSQVEALSGPSDRTVVMCQEGAQPIVTYRADAVGFNNPADTW